MMRHFRSCCKASRRSDPSHHRVENSHDGVMRRGKGRSHSPTKSVAPQQIEYDADEPVRSATLVIHRSSAPKRGSEPRDARAAANVQRTSPAFDPAAEQHQDQHQRSHVRRMLSSANSRKSVISRRSANRPKPAATPACRSSPSRDRCNGLGVAGFAVVRHHQRPGRERHEFPAQQIGNASAASTTRFMPARKAGKNGSTRLRRLLVIARSRDRIDLLDAPPRLTTTRKNEASTSRRKDGRQATANPIGKVRW